MSLPSLSIIIPTFNGLALLRRCLRSVCAYAPPHTQIIVVDDASTDDTVAWLGAHYPQVTAVRLETNQGFCGVVNAGLRHVTGEVVELLNNDTEVFPGWADACLAHFADPTVGSVAPLVTRLGAPDVIDSSGQGYHICGWAFDRGHGRPVQVRDLIGGEVFGPSGSCGFYRTSAVRQLGGLWPVYGFYFEDTDLAFRLGWAGWRNLYEPTSRVGHLGSATTGGPHSDRTVRLLARNEEIVHWANVPGRDLLLGLAPHLAFLLVRLVRSFYRGQAGPFLLGKLDFVRNCPAIVRRRREIKRLAARGERPPRLLLARDTAIFRQGVNWLFRRQCA
jgi:GT2 family glycosyltransferase